MLIFWVVLLILLIVVEAVTAQMVTIWFAAGAAGAIVAELLGAQVWLQWIVFIAVSAVALVATRPLVRKLTKTRVQPTNADRCIGQTAVVTEEIDNIAAKGQVNVNGIIWSARSSDGSVIQKDAKVTVEKIDGVKLIVKTN
ncbi:MAG: NfeD family protein [Clostridia bacterium]|nr:NfeD family protein [Clostridia bacterium]MBQ7122500.1 NfeD family protein [Clostridia bacterium]